MEIEELLAPQERILCRTRMHPAVYAIPAQPSTFCFLFLVAAVLQSGIIQLLLLLISTGFLLASVGIFFFSVLPHAAAELLLTDRRLLSARGLLKIRLTEIPLEEVESSELGQGALGRWLNYGRLRFSGGEQSCVRAFVHDPQGFKDSVERAKKSVESADAADSNASPQAGSPRAA